MLAPRRQGKPARLAPVRLAAHRSRCRGRNGVRSTCQGIRTRGAHGDHEADVPDGCAGGGRDGAAGRVGPARPRARAAAPVGPRPPCPTACSSLGGLGRPAADRRRAVDPAGAGAHCGRRHARRPRAGALEWRPDDGLDVVRRRPSPGRSGATRSTSTSVGCTPGRWYFYRFRVRDQLSPVGRTRHGPGPGRDRRPAAVPVRELPELAVGLLAAVGRTPPRTIRDLVLHLGDYIYEGPAGTGPSIVRPHNGPEIVTLDDYRNRYGRYSATRRCRASTPPARGRHLGRPRGREQLRRAHFRSSPRRPPSRPAGAGAYQAWWEHMPAWLPAPTGPDLAIYRSLDWGRLARFHVLDTRQYRSDQPRGDGTGPTCPERTDPARPRSAPTRRRGSARAWRRPGPPGTCWPTRSS